MKNNPVDAIEINYNGPSRIQYSGIYSESITLHDIPSIPYKVDFLLDNCMEDTSGSTKEKDCHKDVVFK